MAKQHVLVQMFDPRPLLKRCRFRAGPIEARGVPAILLGVATIVAARGLTSALHKAAAVWPESLREAREFWLAVRAQPQILPYER